MLPQLAQGSANKVFVIPSEYSQALSALTSRFVEGAPEHAAPKPRPSRSNDEIDARAAADAEEAARAAREASQQAESATDPLGGAVPRGAIAPPPPEPTE